MQANCLLEPQERGGPPRAGVDGRNFSSLSLSFQHSSFFCSPCFEGLVPPALPPEIPLLPKEKGIPEPSPRAGDLRFAVHDSLSWGVRSALEKGVERRAEVPGAGGRVPTLQLLPGQQDQRLSFLLSLKKHMEPGLVLILFGRRHNLISLWEKSISFILMDGTFPLMK